MEPKKLLTIFTLVLVVLFTGCKKDDFVEIPGLCPLVLSTDPANNATGVPLNKVITATFNEEMDPATITASSFTIAGVAKGESLSEGVVSYSGNTATFTPNTKLLPNTTYTGTITKAIRDLNGLYLQADYVWTFKTASVPTVTLVDPLDVATGVALNKVVSASFSEAMDPLTITTLTFTLMNGAIPVPGAVVYSGTTATFTPTNPLLLGKTYTATVKTGARSINGVALASNYVWTFSTGALIAPTVILTDPLNLATNVALDKLITARFSVPMDPLTITTSTFKLKDGLLPIVGVVTYSGSTATFTSASPLLTGKTYTATITNGVKNVAGTVMLNNYVWAFSTGAVVAPTVIDTDPMDEAVSVPLNQKITASFSEAMDPLTLTSSTFTLMNGAIPVTGVVTYSDITATFTPSSALLGGKTYTATITTGAKNVAGTAMLVNYVWTFSTGAVLAPTVTGTDPLSLATNVALNKLITATFSVPMDPLTITTTTFKLMDGLIPIIGAVTYAGSTATFTPASALTLGKTYTATITNGVKNVAGTAMLNNYVWAFSTGAAVAPTVIDTDPLDVAIDVPLNQVIGATFSIAMDQTTITTSTFTLMDGLIPVTGIVAGSGINATFTPDSPLLAGKTYTATVTTGAKNLAGTAMVANKVWTFSTVAGPPTVISTVPLNNATGVLLNQSLTADFSVPMDPTTITGTTFTLMEGLNSVAGVVTYAGTTATFNPSADLLAGTVYTATITTGAKNVAGTALAANKVWTFTTVSGPPTVISVSPLNGATGVAQSSLVTANFSVPMDALTITGSTFTLLQGLTPVAGVVSYLGSTATFDPTADLMSGSTFTATITTGAKNVAGTPLTSNYVWTFSTGAKGPGIVDLGTAGNFVAIGKTGISTTGTTAITGDIGVSPAAATFITGFGLVMDVTNTFSTTVPTTLVTGKVYASDYAVPTPAYMTQAVSDMETALTTAMGLTTTVIVDLGAGDISGMTLAPGLYKYNTGLLITASGVTLEGGPEDTWVFQISSDLTVNNSAMVTLAGGALAKNIFWVTNTQAVLGTGVNFKGNILAKTLISLNTGATVLGRLLSQTAVTLNASTVVKP